MHREKGSFTIEATLSLSVFMFAFVTIISLAAVAKTEGATQYAINQAAKEISRYCYIADRAHMLAYPSDGSEKKVDNVDDAIQSMYDFADTAKTVGTSGTSQTGMRLSERLSNLNANDFQSIGAAAQDLYNGFGPVFSDPKGTISALVEVVAGKAASAIVSRVVAQPLCKAIVPKYITPGKDAGETLEKMGVEGGLDGLDFSMSSFLMDGRTINIVLIYKIKVNGFRVFDQTVVVKQTASTAAWLSNKNGKKLSDLADKESYWDKPDLERGKDYVEKLQNEKPHQGVAPGIGVDLYDQDSNTFTSVHSMNVFCATYSQYQKTGGADGAGNYTPDKKKIKAAVRGYATELQRNVAEIGENIEMADGTECMTAKDAVKQRKCEVIVAVPDEARGDPDWRDTLNEVAKEIEAETGVKVNFTYRDNALGEKGETA